MIVNSKIFELDVSATSQLWDEFNRIRTASDVDVEDDDELLDDDLDDLETATAAGVEGDEYEDFSEGSDATNSVSIQSTPRPTLRPFFQPIGSSEDNTLNVVSEAAF
ncbi:unnamed protein product [Protopolystoma xenopodis]|uniref:Uncharacterized protein n=1 Tax=Protopolystoma xenopodis TaxID=117903 RepID=A0A3S5AH20_9PLAT|nr:unnamed protein product [Protopolystoma xenopodis]